MRFLDTPLGQVFSCLCTDVNNPRSLACLILAKNDDLDTISRLDTDPEDYLSSEAFFKDLVCVEFIRKLDDGDQTKIKRLDTECWERFEKTERQCAVTNVRMSRFLLGGPYHPSDLRLFEFIEKVKNNIRHVVGRLPENIGGVYGPGATLTTPARRSTIPDKLSSAPVGTTSALYLYNSLFSDGGWDRARSRAENRGTQLRVRGNRFFTVNKDMRKRRGACLSPSVNSYLQLGISRVIRERLTKVGIHISGGRSSDSAKRHRQLAYQASIDGSLATIDLSDASNTVARKLIQLLWPREWFEVLDELREPLVERPDGKFQYLEMLSAMGNGFTFEVETLTFWAIAKACCPEGIVSTFGDDIIVPTEFSKDVIAALRWCGFSINKEKTFITGAFRESCGGDFFDGTPTRCYYAKIVPSEPSDWISVANGIRRMAFGSPHTEHRWSYLRRAWRAALGNIPSHIQNLRGPIALGDLVIHDSNPRVAKYEDGIMYWRALLPQMRARRLSLWSSDVQLAAALYGVPSSGPIPREAPMGYRIKLIPWTY